MAAGIWPLLQPASPAATAPLIESGEIECIFTPVARTLAKAEGTLDGDQKA